MRVYTSKLTPDSVVTYLLHDWTQPVIVLPSEWGTCVGWSAIIKVQYTPTDTWKTTSSSRVRNNCGIKRVLLRISIWFSCHFAGFHVANRVVTLLLLMHRFIKSFSAFFVANAMAHAHRQRMYHSFHDASLWPSADQLFALNRGCALVYVDKLSAVSYDTFTHSRHNAGG